MTIDPTKLDSSNPDDTLKIEILQLVRRRPLAYYDIWSFVHAKAKQASKSIKQCIIELISARLVEPNSFTCTSCDSTWFNPKEAFEHARDFRTTNAGQEALERAAHKIEVEVDEQYKPPAA